MTTLAEPRGFTFHHNWVKVECVTEPSQVGRCHFVLSSTSGDWSHVSRCEMFWNPWTDDATAWLMFCRAAWMKSDLTYAHQVQPPWCLKAPRTSWKPWRLEESAKWSAACQVELMKRIKCRFICLICASNVVYMEGEITQPLEGGACRLWLRLLVSAPVSDCVVESYWTPAAED